MNRVNEELVDYSCPVLEPKLAFTLIGNDVAMFNALVACPGDPTASTLTGDWSDPLARRLHGDWFARLKRFSLSGEQTFDPS